MHERYILSRALHPNFFRLAQNRLRGCARRLDVMFVYLGLMAHPLRQFYANAQKFPGCATLWFIFWHSLKIKKTAQLKLRGLFIATKMNHQRKQLITGRRSS